MAFPSAPTNKLRLRGLSVLVLAAIAFAPALHAEPGKQHSTRPILYNLIVKEADPVDQQIRERYGSKYEIVEIRKGTSYVSARLTRAPFPNPVYDKANMQVEGTVRVFVVVTADGRLVDPLIVGSANPLLSGPVLEAIKGYRAIPARVNGVPANVVDGLRFRFGPPARRRIDTG